MESKRRQSKSMPSLRQQVREEWVPQVSATLLVLLPYSRAATSEDQSHAEEPEPVTFSISIRLRPATILSS